MVVGGIVAGGIGSRMGNSSIPKQFLIIGEKPIIIHTIEKFLMCSLVDKVVVGIHADWQDYLEELITKYIANSENILLVLGGNHRNGTIKNIIDAASEQWDLKDDAVFVTHDAVRPFVSLKIIEENIKAAQAHNVCDTVIVASDTIVRSEDGKVIKDIPLRSEMYQGQTPQSFTKGVFSEVYDSMSEEELQVVTDACKMFYLRDLPVFLVEGNVTNFKITYQFDLKMAKSMLEVE